MSKHGPKIGGAGGSGGSSWDDDDPKGIHMGHVVVYGLFIVLPVSMLIAMFICLIRGV